MCRRFGGGGGGAVSARGTLKVKAAAIAALAGVQ